ncbi:hypothetical protein M514_00775 [Trichuris suis]|uniref:Band 7 domain-containing protein n=1 Tax=Trichuris suis TaxID=68888 RepID=A0A085N9C9_9BILA|nr:hypothetical protein M514_00775 [Trichuris suis]
MHGASFALDFNETQQPTGTGHRLVTWLMNFIWMLTFPLTFSCSTRILQPFESVVRYRLGKVSVHGGRRKTSGHRTLRFHLLTQEMVPASLTVTARRQIFDPLKLVTTTKLFVQLDTLAFLQATLLDAIASTTLSELCGQRRIVSERITQNINAITFDWGIEYDVTITDVEVPKDIVEALKVEEEIVSKIYALVGTNLVLALKVEEEIVSKIYALEVARKIEKENQRTEGKLAKATQPLQVSPDASFSTSTKSENNIGFHPPNTQSKIFLPTFHERYSPDQRS